MVLEVSFVFEDNWLQNNYHAFVSDAKLYTCNVISSGYLETWSIDTSNKNSQMIGKTVKLARLET